MVFPLKTHSWFSFPFFLSSLFCFYLQKLPPNSFNFQNESSHQKSKSPPSSLSFPYLNHSHPLTHLPKSDQPPFLTPLCPPLPNLNVGVGWWEWVQPPTHIAIKAVGRPRRRGVRLFEESRASPKRRTSLQRGARLFAPACRQL